MIDKPIPAKILLHLLDKKATGEEFISLSGELYRQNLIYSEPRELRRYNNVLELTVIFRDVDSYKHWNKNKEIKSYWNKKFKKILSQKPKTIREKDVIIEVDAIRNCVCKKSEYYILNGRITQLFEELTCGTCLQQIPYSRIPLNIEIEDWQRKYERVWCNWLESGLFEKEALKELTNYKKGKLNLEGEKIRQQLSQYFNIPVYINYFAEESDPNQTCFICGSMGEDGMICKECNTIF